MKWDETLKKILDLLERYLPSLVVAFMLGKKAGSNGRDDAEKSVQDLELENERLKNKIAHDQKYSGKSDLDVVNDALRSGGVGSKAPGSVSESD